MKNIYRSSFNFIKRHKVLSIIGILVLLGIIWFFVRNSSETQKLESIAVSRGSISEIVSVTGSVKPLSDVDLAFERGGKVANINVSVGDTVYVGQSLASVSNADLVASLDRARADLKIASLQLGNKTDQVSLDLKQAQISLTNTIRDSYTKADDALRNKVYSLFNDPVRYRAKLAFTTDSFLEEDIEKGKDDMGDILDDWYRSLSKLNEDSSLDDYYNTAKIKLVSLKSLLDKSATAVNSLSPESSNATQVQIDSWKLNISTARTNIDSTITALDTAWDKHQAANLAVKNSQTDLSVQGVTVEQAQAGVSSAEAELAKSIIKSPIDGVITSIDTKLGEIVSANKNVISVISYGDYEIESFVPEADIAKVKITDKTDTTLDAYGSDVIFETSVTKIDPAATIIDGVPTYKVTLKFNNQDERVRSGMTANLDILTNKKDDVLVLPTRLVVSKDDGKYVSIINLDDQSEIIEKKIVTGLRGSDGNVEIVSGLSEGDKVVTPGTK